MRIVFNNDYLYTNKKNRQSSFKGKGINYLDSWLNVKHRKLKYYQEIMSDISEGAKLYFEKNKEVDDVVKGFHEHGGLTVFFDLPNEEILKVSLENPIEYRSHNPDFDIPFLSSVDKYGKTYIVKQPKADTKNITNEHFLDVVKRIHLGYCELSSDGYKYEQYGLYKGKPYLIDTRCAMPLPNKWTIIIDAIYRKINKCYTSLSIEQDKLERDLEYQAKGYLSYHCDETPRRSLTFKGGLLKIYYAIKNNIKYKKNCHSIPYEEYKSQKMHIDRFIKV